MSTTPFAWNPTTLYTVRCVIYSKNTSRSFLRPTYAKDPIDACLEADKQLISHSVNEKRLFSIYSVRSTKA